MPSTNEQRLDIIKNCDILLNGILKPFPQTDDSPEGRMITQLNWLKERAENNDLSLPVDPLYISSLRYIFTDGELLRHASKNTKQVRHEEIDIYLARLMSLTKHGHLLLKPIYYRFALRYVDRLIGFLQHPARPLNTHEKGAITEFQELRLLLAENKIEPPLDGFMPYENIIDSEDTLRDMPECLRLFRVATKLIFEGVRPDTWLTPDDADRETRQWA